MEVARFRLRVQEQVMKLAGITPPVIEHQLCILCPVPLFHVTAAHHVFLASIFIGRKLVLCYKWDAGKALEIIEKERVTNWTGVPTMIQDLMLHPNFSKTDVSSIMAIGSGGAPTPPSAVPKILQHFVGAMPTNGYGLTETNGAISWNMGPDYVARPGSCGTAFPVVEVKVVDPETGSDLGRNKPGELFVKGALVMKEYWKRPDATAEVLKDGWFNTKDVAVIDSEGFIYIVDRAKDIIIRGGENISCAEVEAAFYSHPSVRECAAFSLPDERLGEVVGLLIMLHNSEAKISREELTRHVSPKLAGFKIPATKNIFFTNEALPRGATGKINKKGIKETIIKKMRSQSKL
eukprot:TRINITY_DN1153_c0_g1_i1.p1 TRINITY_DN1153_c0_g1~~TRINITY_DN1153_c0_g1_i1.p1  ORF type:complete len:349 (+),score=63.88 TRINITY_DN1153_c0_g1_i1:833-1879(+)